MSQIWSRQILPDVVQNAENLKMAVKNFSQTFGRFIEAQFFYFSIEIIDQVRKKLFRKAVTELRFLTQLVCKEKIMLVFRKSKKIQTENFQNKWKILKSAIEWRKRLFFAIMSHIYRKNSYYLLLRILKISWGIFRPILRFLVLFCENLTAFLVIFRKPPFSRIVTNWNKIFEVFLSSHQSCLFLSILTSHYHFQKFWSY